MRKNLYTILFLLSAPTAMLRAQTAVTDSLNFSGGIQTYTVPCGVTSLTIECYGAQGGSGATGGIGAPGGAGGLGAYATGTLAVSPGDILNVFVGGAGATPTGGFNGGANGGSQNAGGGGGASDVRIGGTALGNRVITAGGGGGGGRAGCESSATINGGNGGVGGGGSGANGIDAPTSGGSAGGGFGGTISAGGNAGIGCGGFLGSPGTVGTSGNGGVGGSGQSCCCFSNGSIPGGGGGGGGFLGGGGGGGGSAGTTGCSGNDKGGGGGGAGGSNDVSGVTSGSSTNGIRTGNGVVKISYLVGPPAPTASGGPSAMCFGSTDVFSVNTIPGVTTYNWSVPAGLTITSGTGTNSITVMATGMTGGNVTVSATDACGNTGASISFVLNINANPTVTATANSAAICNGNSDTLNATGGVTYAWSSGGTSSMEVVSPSTTTTFDVIGVDANGCADTASVAVTVNALPTVTATADTAICNGGTATMMASGATSYAWSSGGTAATEMVSPTTSTGYQVIGTDANGCSNWDSVYVLVNPNPAVTASATSTTTCAGDADTLSVTSGFSYAWSSGGSGSTEVVSPTSTTTYSVTATNTSTGCSSVATVTVNVNPLPVVTLTLADNNACVTEGPMALSGGSPTGGTWSGPGVTGSNFSPVTAGVGAHTITYTFTNGNGCTNTATSTITVSPCVGMAPVNPQDEFSYSPNPATDHMLIRWGSNVNVKHIDVVDIQGRVLMSEDINSTNTLDLKVSSLPAGAYNLVVTKENEKVNYRFVKN